MAQVTVTIDGKAYRMACEEGQEDHLTDLATRFDRYVGHLKDQFAGVFAPQPMQRTRSSRPCRSITWRWPADWCSRSTFWVSSIPHRPLASSRASA